LSTVLQQFLQQTQSGGIIFLLASFVIAAILKTAQGSSTSALIITSSIVGPLATAAGFHTDISLALLVAAIGAGGMSVSHSNDSYFWVVSQFSGFSLKQAYASITLLTAIQGIIALLTVIILYLVCV
jgi:GntP family gluconate:H+ symporter